MAIAYRVRGAASSGQTLGDRALALATVLVGTGAVMSSLSNSSLNVAFPELTATFGVPPATIAWVSLAHFLVTASLIASPLSDGVGTRLPTPAGLALQAFACFLLTQVSPAQGAWPALLAGGLAGVGIGTFIAPNDSAILSATPPQRLGVANGIMGVARTLGLLLGVSAAGTLLSARLVANGDAFLPSFHQVYWVVFAVTSVGIGLAAARDPRR